LPLDVVELRVRDWIKKSEGAEAAAAD